MMVDVENLLVWPAGNSSVRIRCKPEYHIPPFNPLAAGGTHMSKPAVPEGHICPWINLCKLLINAVSLSIKIRKNKQGYVFLQLVPNVVVILS